MTAYTAESLAILKAYIEENKISAMREFDVRELMLAHRRNSEAKTLMKYLGWERIKEVIEYEDDYDEWVETEYKYIKG